jgi:phosphate transport system permease protein
LKAAFYAMMVAVPLAVLGAIFAAYFMSPKMRGVVKPSIEIMEALPTVILGFLAGLWLAPFVDNNLAGTLVAIFLLPFSFVITAYLWHRLPESSDPTRRSGLGSRAADSGDHLGDLGVHRHRSPDRSGLLQWRHAELGQQ